MLLCVLCGELKQETMNKRLKLWIGCCLCLLGAPGLTGCSEQAPGEPGTEEGDPVSLRFSLYRAEADEASTRADAATDMEDGKTFCIYAFPAGASTTTTEPLDHKVYTVKGGVATGEFYLYRGTYDLYLVSYNSSTEVPELKTDGTIQVSNGKDFMYTSLKGIVVQPNQTGENMMDVVLPAPFKRLGAQIKVSVAAGDFQPVTPTSLVVNSFEMGGLRASLPYTLGSTAWGAVANETFATTQSFTGFTNNTASHDIKTSRESTPVVVLPVDGSAMISFKVNLTVGYNDNGVSRKTTNTYPAEIQKVLLPGMTYMFAFTLTFYGILDPADLTLAIGEYESTVTLDSDEMGK